jgi:branched-chain amino acid transport system ATP-binding protein
MRFGGLLAVRDVEFRVTPNEVFAIIGPNGAGKTTVFNCLSGFYRPTSGTILLDGRNVSGARSHTMARKGVVRTFQNVRLFRQLTALENLLVAQHQHLRTGLLAGLFRSAAYRAAESAAMENAAEWLDFMGLRDYANRPSGELPYGHQRKLEIARCMITRPRVLMLDEPAAGLNPSEKQGLSKIIEQLRSRFGVAVLLIEHDASLVMGVSDRILVMDYGQTIAQGAPDEIRTDPRVIKAYLGEE